MEKQLYETLYKVEENYWWFVGQRTLVNRFLTKYYGSKNNLKILDAGCGTGINLKMFAKFGDVCGIDISDEALNFCALRGGKVKKSNIMAIKFKDKAFDIVAALGIFYHNGVTDEIKGMKEIYRVLKPGGRLIFVDSAMKCLYGKHDIAFHGVRRYSKRDLKSKLEKAGFNVEKISYFNMILFPVIYIYRKLNNIINSKPKSEVSDINHFLNSLLINICRIENIGLKYLNYPFGVNIFAIARKPE